MFFIRFAVYFVFSFAILCFHINGDTLFEHMYRFTSPYARKVNKVASQKMSSVKRYGKKLFDNSRPKELDQDEINLELSATDKSLSEPSNSSDEQVLEDEMTNEEKESLKKILLENQQ